MNAEEIKQRYEAERVKRLRPDMQKQYMTSTSKDYPGELSADPWVDYDALAAQEPPVADGGEVKVLITGGGAFGLTCGYYLTQAGVSVYDMCVAEIGGGFGGTWYWNRYPGLMCDVEGYCYMALLEEFGYVPKHRYSYGQEIRGQLERIAKRTGLDERALFATRVVSQVWDDQSGKWTVELLRDLGPHGQRRMTVKARYVICANGTFPVAKIPSLPGLADLRAGGVKVIHTSRWDWKYTGGTQEVPDMVNLKDKKVAVVGTGATAIQVVPEVAKWAKHLYVVQRTPSYCGPRNQGKTDPEEWRKVAYKKGWQRERQANLNQMMAGEVPRLGRDLVNDGWTHTPGGSGFLGSSRKGVVSPTPDQIKEHIDEMVKLDMERTAFVRSHIKKVVKSPELADKLSPWYPSWCKRPTFHDDYLMSFNRDNVTLVDTDGKGITEYTSQGIVANGQKMDVDVLILATGFLLSPAAEKMSESLGSTITGAGGRDFDEGWNARDFQAPYMGVGMHDFPNLFGYFYAGYGVSYNFTSGQGYLGRIIAHVVSSAEARAGDGDDDARRVVVRATRLAQQKYSAELRRGAAWFSVMKICTPTYFTGEGSLLIEPETEEEAIAKANHGVWGTGLTDWGDYVDRWMAGGIEGFEVEVV
ncbi:hypothetical protein MGG_00824 [Pyricularia oryzae 70-15]|uniref:Phenylacetone monooxygenase n=1 Tax=Pyricularia oryzae (strain 70-15 / ATCC MYA-4617 / FGSC 8958) TaxID=242507 RepID=G4NE92_PYRO7|nr:uncharacterized protein MGG_00824 [Pyricularia oryzae 70-15]EHA48575.1 hypothetical protein MGG_00824 [Pyricularia oryzae 70-15]